MTGPADAAFLMTVLTTTALTLGTLLAIITAGLMFSQGKFSELASELDHKSSDYLAAHLTMERLQAMGSHLVTLREEFQGLDAASTVVEERSLYGRILDQTSSLVADCAVLLNLKSKQSGWPTTDLLTSGMDPGLYEEYRRRMGRVRKDWHMLIPVMRIRDGLEGARTGFSADPAIRNLLDDDIRKTLAILKFKGSLGTSPAIAADRIGQAFRGLKQIFDPIAERLRKDRIPQLLPQMKQLHEVRGRSFHLAVIFISTPLLLDLVMLPLLGPETAAFLRPFIFAACLLSLAGVAFLLIYIYKLLKV